MALPGSGQITLKQIHNQFGGPYDLKAFYRGAGYVPNAMLNQNIPTGGQISVENFYGSDSVYPGMQFDGGSGGGGFSTSYTIPNYNLIQFIVQGGGGGGYGSNLGDTGGDGGTSSIIASGGGTWISATGGGGCTSAAPGAGGYGYGQYPSSGGSANAFIGGMGGGGASGGARASSGSWPSGGGGGYGGYGGGGGGYALSNWTPGSGGPWPGQVVTINVGAGGWGGSGGGGWGASGRVQIIVY